MEIKIVPATTLPSLTYWKALHATIITSFKHEAISAFPPSWTRLDPDVELAAEKLAAELGPNGYMAVALIQGQPVACGGVLPSRGLHWIEEVVSVHHKDLEVDTDDGVAEPAQVATKGDSSLQKGSSRDWEICCFCVHPRYRGQGLSTSLIEALSALIEPKGAVRLLASYSVEETGQYWPKKGFSTIPGAGGTLKRGFTHTRGMPGLLEDLHFRMGALAL